MLTIRVETRKDEQRSGNTYNDISHLPQSESKKDFNTSICNTNKRSDDQVKLPLRMQILLLLSDNRLFISIFIGYCSAPSELTRMGLNSGETLVLVLLLYFDTNDGIIDSSSIFGKVTYFHFITILTVIPLLIRRMLRPFCMVERRVPLAL